jgi:hypothetical protein
MGADLGPLFHALSTELTWIQWRWRQFRVLYGEKPTRIDLLNEAAPFFFRLVQDVFFEDTLLAIARIVGAPASLNKPNLTVARLTPLISDPALAARVSRLVASARSAAAFAVDWRNRHLAHRDLALALKVAPIPLASASRQHVEGALSLLRDTLNAVESAYCNATTAYDISPTVGDAEQLLNVIRDGLARGRERSARWQRGEFSPDDEHPEAV